MVVARDPDVAARQARVLDELGPGARPDVALGPLTTYRVGGTALVYAEVGTLEELRRAAAAARGAALPMIVVGRGSNMLVADRGVDAVVVRLGAPFERIDVVGTSVWAGGAVALPVLARRTVAAGLTGMEWCVGVPGSVGGAVRMNAGGHGSDVAARLVEVHRFACASGDDGVVPVTQLQLAFRSSALTDDDVVLSATFALEPGDRAAGEAELTEIVRWRREHQPGGQNCGSVFVNPLPRAAGELIDALDLRGTRVGSAQVSPKHANFIQADAGGSADDVLALMRLVHRRVLDAHGVSLRSEVRLVGFEHGIDDVASAEIS